MIVAYDEAAGISIRAKKKGKKIVLATGCFDILHWAHKEFLLRAKHEGNLLFVGLESDARVRFLKGKGRPVNSWAKRAEKLAGLSSVDYVFKLPQGIGRHQVQETLISGISPDIYAVSSHTSFIDNKKAIVEKYKGKLKVVMPQIPAISTTKIFADIGRQPIKRIKPRK